MKLYLLSCGQMSGAEKQIFEEYRKRINFVDFFLKEIIVKEDTPSLRIIKESQEINKFLNNNDLIKSGFNHTILMHINGKQLDSKQFSNLFNNFLIDGLKNITFIIGGSFGVDQKIIELSNQKISFGLNTWPHNLMKVMLIEQIFRAQTILQKKNYHH